MTVPPFTPGYVTIFLGESPTLESTRCEPAGHPVWKDAEGRTICECDLSVPGPDRVQALRDAHRAAFSAALCAAVAADPELDYVARDGASSIWVSYGGNGNVGYWVSTGLRDTHRPAALIGASLTVSYVNDEDEDEPTISYTVLDESVAPNQTHDIAGLAAAAITAIHQHAGRR